MIHVYNRKYRNWLFCLKMYSYTNNRTNIIFSNIILQQKLSRLSLYSRRSVHVWAAATVQQEESFFQCMEPPLRKNTKHTLEIFVGKCPMIVSSFITVITYLSAAFVSSLVHTSSFVITVAQIALCKSLSLITHYIFSSPQQAISICLAISSIMHSQCDFNSCTLHIKLFPCKIIFAGFDLCRKNFLQIFFHRNFLDKNKVNYGTL